MIDPTVRPAVAGDVAEITALEEEARAGLLGARGGDRWLRDHVRVGSSWVGVVSAGGVFVAHIDTVVVGYISMTVDRWLATVDDVYITPEARELGFGEALLVAAVRKARTLGATTLDATALPGDRETKNLYERAGIKARAITVSTEL